MKEKTRKNLLKSDFKVEILETPKTKPIGGYSRKWWTLWLLKTSDPSYLIESRMVVRLTFDKGENFDLVIPTGYVCDFASIPRPLWMLWPPDGLHRYAAVPHDFGYESEVMRSFMDRLFVKLLQVLEVDAQVVRLFYAAVRVGGAIVYAKHKRARVAEVRTLLASANPPETVELLLGGDLT